MKSFSVKLIIFIIFISFLSLPVIAEEEILILLDSSVSMYDFIDNQPKYKLAARAAKKVLSGMNNSQMIGLRIIGMQMNMNILNYIQSPDLLCKATELVNPITRNNVVNISNSLDMLIPLGTTPLTYSLQEAINKDFTQNADLKHIILITDGAESCDQDPCKFIKELYFHRKDVKIDVIAINVEGNDFLQLKCLSDNSRGNIKQVKSENEIESAFQTLITSYNVVPSFATTNYSNVKASVNIQPSYNINYSIQQKARPKRINYKNYAFEFTK